MTLDQFFKKLAKLKNKPWKIEKDPSKSIRYIDQGIVMCPITAVCLEETNKCLGQWSFTLAANNLNLDSELALLIVAAADGVTNKCVGFTWKEEVVEIRERILQVLGLER